MKLTNNTILITGGTSGIGRALAEAFHERGNEVIIAGRRQPLLDEITAANPGMHGLPLDMENPRGVVAFAAQVREQFPHLNVLVNNAGISRREDLTSDTFDVSVSRSILETNLMAVIELTAALLPTLRRQPNAAIVTTTSNLAFVPSASYPTYCASKAFLHSWLQSLRFQLRETPVQVLELIPPYVQTELTGPSQASDPRALPLSDFIHEVMPLLEEPNPPRGEILVERGQELRFAEKNDYAHIFAAKNNR